MTPPAARGAVNLRMLAAVPRVTTVGDGGEHRGPGGLAPAISAFPEKAMSLSFDVFVVNPKPIPSAVPGFEDAVGQATWPPSTSTPIRDDGRALLVDCLITEEEGRDLATWVKSHDTDPEYVYVTSRRTGRAVGSADRQRG